MRAGEEGRLTGLVSAAWAAGSLCGAQLHGLGVTGRLRVLYFGLGALLLIAERATSALLRALAAEKAEREKQEQGRRRRLDRAV